MVHIKLQVHLSFMALIKFCILGNITRRAKGAF